MTLRPLLSTMPLSLLLVGCATFDGQIKPWKTTRVIADDPSPVELLFARPRVVDRSVSLKASRRRRLALSLQQVMVDQARKSQGFKRCTAMPGAKKETRPKPKANDEGGLRYRVLTKLRIDHYRTPRGGAGTLLIAIPFLFYGGLHMASYLMSGRLAGEINWILIDHRGQKMAERSIQFDQAIDRGRPLEAAEATFGELLKDAAYVASRARKQLARRPVVRPAPVHRRPVAVILPLRDPANVLSAPARDRALDWLIAQLAELGQLRIVSPESMQRTLRTKSSDSLSDCDARHCQVEIGQALAADRSIVGRLTRIDAERCIVSLVIYDLTTEATDRAASTRCGCSADSVLSGLRSAAHRLGFKREVK